MPAAHAVAPGVEKPEKSLQLSQKITQFRLNLVYQFTQHLRIVKHLLIRADIIFRNSSATKALSHKGYKIILLMPFLIRGTLKLIRKPRYLPVSLKWPSICAFYTGFISTTALSSQTISSCTRISKRSPLSNIIPSYVIGRSTYL